VTNDTREVLGITLDMYFINSTLFRNSTYYPQYYLHAPGGVSNLTCVFNATNNAPVQVMSSMAYFFGADPWWASQVDFNPQPVWDAEDHNTFLFIEPYTGITMKALKRLQVTVKVQGSVLLFPNMSDWFIPIAYFEESGSIDENSANEWKNTVGVALKVKKWGPIILFGVGVGCLSLWFWALVVGLNRQRKNPYQTIDDDDDVGTNAAIQ